MTPLFVVVGELVTVQERLAEQPGREQVVANSVIEEREELVQLGGIAHIGRLGDVILYAHLHILWILGLQALDQLHELLPLVRLIGRL